MEPLSPLSEEYASNPDINFPITNQIRQDPKYINYHRWLIDNGAIFPSVTSKKVEFPVAFGQQGLVGALAKVDIANKKAYTFSPLTICIYPEKVRKSIIGFILEENPDVFSTGRYVDNILYFYLIYERVKHELSFFHPYFEMVPYGHMLKDWSDEQLDELQDDFLKHRVRIMQAMKFRRGVDTVYLKLRPVIASYPDYFPLDEDYYEHFLWAYHLVSTRSFGLEEGILAPIADNLNHRDCYLCCDIKGTAFIQKNLTMENKVYDYSDFDKRIHPVTTGYENRTFRSKLQKYLHDGRSITELESMEAIWEIDWKLDKYESSSDEEELRSEGDSRTEEYEENPEKTSYSPEDRHYFIMTTEDTTFPAGTQVYNCYGRINNQDALMDYGFAYENNNYDSLLFRMWRRRVKCHQGLVKLEDVIKKEYVERGIRRGISYYTELFIVKSRKLELDIFTYYRKQIIRERDLKRIYGKRILISTPSIIGLELLVIERVLALYSEIARKFTTTMAEDIELLEQDPPIQLKFALSKLYQSLQNRVEENFKQPGLASSASSINYNEN